MRKEQKSGFGIVGVLVIIAAIAIGAAGYFLFVHQYCEKIADDFVVCANGYVDKVLQKSGRSFASPSGSESPTMSPVAGQTDTNDWKTYRNEQYGFGMKYDQNFFKKENSEEFLPPEYSKKVNGVKFTHLVPLKYCDAKGQCQSETKNMAIGFYPLANDFQDSINSLKVFFGEEAKESIIAGRRGIAIHTGAEGEGRYYYFLLSHWIGQTLIITRDYIDEHVLTSYQKASGFIPLAEQEKIFDKVLETLIFVR